MSDLCVNDVIRKLKPKTPFRIVNYMDFLIVDNSEGRETCAYSSSIDDLKVESMEIEEGVLVLRVPYRIAFTEVPAT